VIIVLMGVSGSGKTTVGRALAASMGWAFLDADDLHPPVNRAKMAAGEPLDDEDRAPWLARLRALIEERRAAGRAPAVLACSALKRAYRETLRRLGETDVVYVYLRGDPAVLEHRLRNRRGHFVSPGLLASQLRALEEPAPGEAVGVSVAQPVEAVVREIRERLGL
jgi:gluconokinase